MNGKERLLTALRNGPTPRPDWLPFVGVHGGGLIGVEAAFASILPDLNTRTAPLRSGVAQEGRQRTGRPVPGRPLR